jgi:transcriptional regulator with XRE-family HTH domain
MRQRQGKMMGMNKPLMDQIREAIRTSGKQPIRLAEELGISRSTLSKLMHEERSLSINLLEQLAAVLDLEIILRPRKKKGK